MSFYFVYVLRSIKKTEYIYVGYTTDIKRRFGEHNSGKSKSTKRYLPYSLIHFEAYRNSKDAKRRERYFKTTKGRAVLKTMLKEYFFR